MADFENILPMAKGIGNRETPLKMKYSRKGGAGVLKNAILSNSRRGECSFHLPSVT
jgi:hypothetical protein